MQDEPRDLDIRLTKLEDEIRSLRQDVQRMGQSRYTAAPGSICALCLLCVVYSIPVSICAMCMVQGPSQEGNASGGSICAVCLVCATCAPTSGNQEGE